MKLEIQHGCYGYRREPLLRDICLECAEGETVVLLGPNGAGKSTLLRCMLGLLPWRSGKTCLDGTDIRTMPSRTFWSKVGYVPQAASEGLSLETEEMMLLGRSGSHSLFSQPGQADRAAVRYWMERLGILHLLGKRCSRISGGELQLVRLGRALAGGPSILVMDEPESGLDFKNRLHFLSLLKELKEEGLQMIFSTHDPQQGYDAADSVLLLNGRGECRFGPTKEMLAEEPLEWAYDVGIGIGRIKAGTEMKPCILPYEKRRQKGERIE